MKTWSTKQAAKQAGIHWVTLLRWMAAGRVRASQIIQFDGEKHWRWTELDVRKLKEYKLANYRKGRGRKPKPKR
jgi:predicted site-specific integrase-resolvase